MGIIREFQYLYSQKYFREIFSDIDHNFDGKINFSELHEALIRGMMIL